MGKNPVLAYFILVFALTIPFLVLGAATGIEVLPGVPIAALAFVCPTTAAAILRFKQDGWRGVVQLLERSFDFKRIPSKLWFLPTLLLMPIIMTLSFFVIKFIGTDIPSPHINAFSVLVLGVIFFIAAIGEELGWSGFAIEPMQARLGALNAGIVLGIIWAVWHYIPLIQAHRSVAWISWWTLWTVAARVIIVWLFNNTGKSVFVAVLFHMTMNLTWQLFPVNGSYFEPDVTGPIMAVTVVAIAAFWGRLTLAKFRTD